MVRFNILSPDKQEDAVSILGQYENDAIVLAGGTDLIILMQKGIIQPKCLVSIRRIPNLNKITVEGDFICLGALVTHNQVKTSELIKSRASSLVEACSQVGSPQIRNLATVVGNIANASPAADSVLPLMVLDAELDVVDKVKEQKIKLNSFFVGPRKTVLKPGQMIKAVCFRGTGYGEGSAFCKLGKRSAVTISVASAAAYVRLDKDGLKIETLRLALGAVAPIPVRAYGIESKASGLMIDDCLKLISQEVCKDIQPITDFRATKEYREKVAAVLARRAVVAAVMQARNSLGVELCSQ